MAQPSLEKLMAMIQQTLNSHGEMTADIRDIKQCLTHIEHHLDDCVKRRRTGEDSPRRDQ